MMTENERGQMIVLFALAFIGLAAAIGLATDGAILFFNRADLSSRADAAALAGGSELPVVSEAEDRARQYLALHNVLTSTHTISITVNSTRILNDTLAVTVTRPVGLAFLPLVGINTVNVSAAATVLTSSWAGDQDYAMFRGGSGRTGSQTCTSLDAGVEAVGYEWGYRWDLYDTKNHRSTPAIYADSSIHNGHYVAYVGSNGTNATTPPASDAGVYAFDGDDGTQLWHTDLSTKVRSSPLVAIVSGLNNGYPAVFVGGHDGKTYALDARDGSLLWQTANNNDSYEDDGKYRSSPALVDGFIYIATSRGNVYKINAVSGAIVWRSTPYPGTYPYANPNIPADWKTTSWGDTPCTSFDGDGNCTDTAAGEPAWWGYTPIYGTAAVYNNIVYIADHGGHEWGGGGSRWPRIYAIDASDGSKVWAPSTYMNWQDANNVNNRQSPTVAFVDTDYDNTPDSVRVYGAPTDGYLYAYDANSGVELWHAYTGQLNHRADPVFFCGVIFGGNGDESANKIGGVWALEAVYGYSIWDDVDNDGDGPDQANPEFTANPGNYNSYGTRLIPGGVKSSPALVDGIILVGANCSAASDCNNTGNNEYGSMWALEARTGKDLGHWDTDSYDYTIGQGLGPTNPPAGTTKGDVRSGVVVGGDSKAYFGSQDGGLYQVFVTQLLILIK